MSYLLNNAIAGDRLANTLLNGSPDETLSARAYRTEQTGKIFGRIFRPLIDAIFWIGGQREHCKKAYSAELRRNQLPRAYQ